MPAMCGRYDLSTNPAAIRAKFSAASVPDFAANADVRPTNAGLVVRLKTDGARECGLDDLGHRCLDGPRGSR
jgi:putative SOS response-associated peptidase YedK